MIVCINGNQNWLNILISIHYVWVQRQNLNDDEDTDNIFGYNAYSGSMRRRRKWEDYGTFCHQGDIIDVELDLKRKQLQFYKNNECIGIAADKLKTSPEWR